MKRKTTITIILLLTLTLAASTVQAQEFLPVEWGTSREKAVVTLGEPDQRTENAITYRGRTIAGNDADMSLYFEQSRLSSGSYTLHVGNNETWLALVEKYRDIFGEPEIIYWNPLWHKVKKETVKNLKEYIKEAKFAYEGTIYSILFYASQSAGTQVSISMKPAE
jgi:hypothetical protein